MSENNNKCFDAFEMEDRNINDEDTIFYNNNGNVKLIHCIHNDYYNNMFKTNEESYKHDETGALINVYKEQLRPELFNIIIAKARPEDSKEEEVNYNIASETEQHLFDLLRETIKHNPLLFHSCANDDKKYIKLSFNMSYYINEKEFNKIKQGGKYNLIRTNDKVGKIKSDFIQKGGDAVSGENCGTDYKDVVYNLEEIKNVVATAPAVAKPTVIPAVATAAPKPTVTPAVATAAPKPTVTPAVATAAATITKPIQSPPQVPITLGANAYTLCMTPECQLKRHDVFNSIAKTKTEEELTQILSGLDATDQQILEDVGFLVQLEDGQWFIQKYAPQVRDFLNELPNCTTDSAILAKQECSKAYYLIFSLLHLVSQMEGKKYLEGMKDLELAKTTSVVNTFKDIQKEPGDAAIYALVMNLVQLRRKPAIPTSGPLPSGLTDAKIREIFTLGI